MGKKEKKPYKRRNYFVKKAFQLSFIFRFFILGLFFSFVVNVFLYFLLSSRIEETLFSAHISVKTVGDIVIPYLVFVNFILLIMIVLFSVLVIRSYHKRISGPLFRFQKAAHEIAQGDLLSKVSLRKGDQLGEIQERFNFMVDGLRGKIKDMKSSFNQLKKSGDEIDEFAAGEPVNIEKLRELTDLFFQRVENLEEKIRMFKS